MLSLNSVSIHIQSDWVKRQIRTPAPAAAAPLSRRAVLGVFAGLVALALLLGALSLKVRSGAHSAHRHR